MTFNVSRCSLMFVSETKNMQFKGLSYKLNKEIFPAVSDVEYLGVVIDSYMKWEKHINKVQ